jgi:predicted transcriptional regulator of viral defense system
MKKQILKMLTEGNGTIKASNARLAGVYNKQLQRLTEAGELERISRGLYIAADQFEDEYFLTQYRCNKCVFSHETALFLHGLSDRTPIQLMMTIPSGFNSRLIKDRDKYKFFYCKPELHESGVITMLSPFGNEIRVYDKERTICDCIRKRDVLDRNIVIEAVKRYAKEKGNDHAELLKYAELFNVRNIVRQYMEVLN